jgi:hypothetical protein
MGKKLMIILLIINNKKKIKSIHLGIKEEGLKRMQINMLDN